MLPSNTSLLFFVNDTETTEIYTLSLHDALPIYNRTKGASSSLVNITPPGIACRDPGAKCQETSALCNPVPSRRSEEHTSELQSRSDLVCRLLLEKKKKRSPKIII